MKQSVLCTLFKNLLFQILKFYGCGHGHGYISTEVCRLSLDLGCAYISTGVRVCQLWLDLECTYISTGVCQLW